MSGTVTVDWTPVCPLDRLEAERGVAALVDGVQVAIFRLDDELFAVDNLDPLSGAYVMSRGIVGSRGGAPTVASPAQAGVRPANRALPGPARGDPAPVRRPLPGRPGRGAAATGGVMRDELAGFTIGVTADRRRDELAALLERRGARVVLAPALRIVPLADDTDLRDATRACLDRPPDVLMANTGIGMRGWLEAAEGWGWPSR